MAKTSGPPPPSQPDPSAKARDAVTRMLARSSVHGHIRVTLSLREDLAQQHVARAIREGRNLEDLLVELVERGADAPRRLDPR